jgi:peptidylprolyl isomerase
MQVKNGSTVNVHYKGTLHDGTEFDNSHVRGETLSFQVGSGQMIRGFNDAVVGMSVGETKTVKLTPDQAYGPRNPEATQVVPKAAFGANFEFEIGGVIQGNGPSGPFLAKIQEVADSEVTLDLNHPLAGEALNFEIEVVSVDGLKSYNDWSPSMKKAELYQIAKSRGLNVTTKFTKTKLVEALRA